MTTKTAAVADAPVIETRAQLIDSFARGEKPRDAWRLGTEHEKLVYRRSDRRAPGWDEPNGIRDLLQGLTEFGWRPIEEGGRLIGLSGPDGSVSLEPAGQFELSGAPRATLHETDAETRRHVEQVLAVGERLGLGFLGLGMWPDKARADLPRMPKGRYRIMLDHMPRVGSMGLDMMLRTCTVQVNLDYASEADMVAKFRTSLALQPLATALFANSPFLEGRPSGYKSYRSHIWSDTDPHRTGMLPFVFEEGFGYERYADYALDVPMYFAYRDGGYVDAAGLSFRDFLRGQLSVLPGERPTMDDWADHLSTAFPEVRLKTFLEMRGADSGLPDQIVALPAFWVGLLYDADALGAAWDLVKHWTIDERQTLRDAVPAQALAAPLPGGGRLADLATRVLDVAEAGLKARGLAEEKYLDPLRERADSGLSPADRLLARFEGEWAGDLGRVYAEESF